MNILASTGKLRFSLSVFLILTILVNTIVWHNTAQSENDKKQISDYINLESGVILMKNSLMAIPEPLAKSPEAKQVLIMLVTAYSSTPHETDNDPYITAAGTHVGPGIVANNILPLGTKIKIPELYGDKIFIVEDRMNPRKSGYQLDIWFPSYWQAKQFGVKKTYIEIVDG